MRPDKRAFAQSVRGPAPRTSFQSPSLTDPCVLILTNRTQEGLSVHAQARTPLGSSFLDDCRVDLAVGGFAILASCVGSDLHLDCGAGGLHKLMVQGGELRLSPGTGLRQRTATAALHFPAKHVLHVDVEEVIDVREHVYPPLRAALDALDNRVARMLAAPSEPLPTPCTLLLPRILPRGLQGTPEAALRKILVLPVAVFFEARREGLERNVNGDEVRITPADADRIVFEVSASVDAPQLRLQGKSTPLRSADRFQLVYLCD
jgi:hypothetical protein